MTGTATELASATTTPVEPADVTTARTIGRTLFGTYGAAGTARFLLEALEYADQADRPVWEQVGALRSLLAQAIGAIEAAGDRLDAEINAHRMTAAAIASIVSRDMRPGDRSSFADGPLAAGPVLVDRRTSTAPRLGNDRRDSAGLIVWSPIRRRWEHWSGAICHDFDSNVEALSRRHPRADVHAPADVESGGYEDAGTNSHMADL